MDGLILYMCNTLGSLRLELVEQGAITGLVDCISHTDARVVSTSVEALALLAMDSMAREQVSLVTITGILLILSFSFLWRR